MELKLEAIKDCLESYDFTASYQEGTENLPVDQVFVYIGQDEKKRPFLLQTRIFSEALDDDTKLSFLNFYVGLPFQVDEKNFNDVSRLILMINKMSPMPAFGLSEPDHIVFFHYSYPLTKEVIGEDILLALISTIMHLVESFSGTFEEVAIGEKSLKDVVDAANAISEEA